MVKITSILTPVQPWDHLRFSEIIQLSSSGSSFYSDLTAGNFIQSSVVNGNYLTLLNYDDTDDNVDDGSYLIQGRNDSLTSYTNKVLAKIMVTDGAALTVDDVIPPGDYTLTEEMPESGFSGIVAAPDLI